MGRMKGPERKRIFRLFARGKTPEQVVELFGDPRSNSAHSGIDLARAERLLEEYLVLPMSEKLRATLMPECVSNRAHRLMDDIADLKLVDNALLSGADEKTLASLLDIKRKIKERMAKEYMLALEGSTEPEGENVNNEINECCKKITGRASAEREVR